MDACKMCGEPRPFRWMGGTHCSRDRARLGLVPLRAEDWPSAQREVIFRESGSDSFWDWYLDMNECL
jgi:hypothetical protein